MSYKIYLASRYSSHPEMREVRDTLHTNGYTVTARWIDCHNGELEESFKPEYLSSNPEFCSTFAVHDYEDLIAADVVISFTGEGGKGGRHVEFGMAYALNKICILVGQPENVFHTLPNVIRVNHKDSIITLLEEMQNGPL